MKKSTSYILSSKAPQASVCIPGCIDQHNQNWCRNAENIVLSLKQRFMKHVAQKTHFLFYCMYFVLYLYSKQDKFLCLRMHLKFFFLSNSALLWNRKLQFALTAAWNSRHTVKLQTKLLIVWSKRSLSINSRGRCYLRAFLFWLE